MQKEINGHKIDFKAWEGKRIYVRIPSKQQGHQQVGYFDVGKDEFVEDKNKGMLQWARYNLDLSKSQIVEICKEVVNPPRQNYVPYVDASGQGW